MTTFPLWLGVHSVRANATVVKPFSSSMVSEEAVADDAFQRLQPLFSFDPLD